MTIRIECIQYPNNIPHCICNNGESIPISEIIGSPKVGKMLVQEKGLYKVVGEAQACNT